MEKRSRGATKPYSNTSAVARGLSLNSSDRSKAPFPKANIMEKLDPKSVKRLPYHEFKDRMNKGLCIHCDEKFTPGHNCKSKQLFMLITEEEESNESDRELAIIWEEGDGS